MTALDRTTAIGPPAVRSEAEERRAVGRLAEAIQVVRGARVELGEEVVVLGDDPRATLAGRLALIAGALSLRYVHPEDLDLAGPKSCDLLIGSTSDPGLLWRGLALVRDLGRVLLFGDPAGAAVGLDVYPDLHKRSIRLIGVGRVDDVPSDAVEYARELLRSGRVDLESI